MKLYVDNFRKHWKEQLIHVAAGAVVGLLGTNGYELAGFTLAFLIVGRQGLEFAKRRDTPGIDLAFHQGGFYGGIGLGIFVV